jgi:membrane-bound lytic murein transglycosylase D
MADEIKPSGVAQVPASEQAFVALREKIRTLAQEAVQLSKNKQEEKAQGKIDEARIAILTFQGTDRQREQLAEEYDLLLALLDELIEPEKRTPADAFTLLLTPPEATAQDLANVEAARHIRNLQRYVDRLQPDARRRIARQLAVFTRNERGHQLFQRYLDRSAAYRDHINRVLAANKLPAELLYVALIESGFSESAYSRAGAAGLWQFMPATARDYGMQVDRWVDERLDWMRATEAAAQYFRNSLQLFSGDIELTVASYNTGPGNVKKAMRRSGEDYWDLRLHPETMDYVPKWIAAMIICSSPQRYGFTIPPDNPQKFDTIAIRGSLDLATMSAAIGQPPDAVYGLNRALIRRATPPDRPWTVRLPAGSRNRLLANLDNLMQASSVVWVAHRLGKDESVAQVAARYNVPLERIISANQSLADHLPEEGEVIMVPVHADNQPALAEIRRQEEEQRVLASLEKPTPPAASNPPPPSAPPPAPPRKISYRVQLRDNLWAIAQRYDVTVDELKQWNDDRIGPGNQIRPGQRLTIYLDGETAPRPAKMTYTVRRGDNLTEIAARYGLDAKTLAAHNGLTVESTLYPGAVLKVPTKGQAKEEPPAKAATHVVSRGETLAGIAARYGLSVDLLMTENDIDNPRDLLAGQTLVIPRGGSSAKVAVKAVHVVKSGETLVRVAKKYGVTVKDLAAANNLATTAELRVGQRLDIPGKAPKGGKTAAKWIKYTVRRGDNLTEIAERYCCTIDDLEKWNNLKRNQPLRAGQVLKIQQSKK